jgi:hypothetical protein
MRTALALIPVFLLVACSDNTPPVTLTGAQTAYFGTWEHAGSEYGNNVVSDNMLLIFHPDSTVSYKRCINRMNGHSYTSLPDAKITMLTDNRLVIHGGFWIINFTRDLPISAPYVEGDDTYFNADGLKLRRLKPGESSTHESWKCDDKKDGENVENVEKA